MRNKKTALIEYNAFPGFSLAEEPASLDAGSLVAGSRDIDLTRVMGALAKRRGIDAQIDSLGDGGIKGIHTYRTAGERVLFGHGTSLYRLIGEALDVTGDLSEGTFNQTKAADGKLQLTLDPASEREVIVGNSESATRYSGFDLGQTFTTGPDVYKLTAVRVKILATYGGNYRMRLYTDINKSVQLGVKTLNLAGGQTHDVTYTFDTPIDVTPNTQYYFEIAGLSSVNEWEMYRGSSYDGGAGYRDGTPTNDFFFNVFLTESTHFSSGDWLSPVYDLGSTPAVSVIEWAETLQPGTTVTVKARGSNDGQVWGYWKEAIAGALPRTRYLQLQVFLTGGANTPEVWDIAVDYETSFTDYEEIKAGLSGNKLRFCDFDGVCYFTDGGRPQRYDGQTVEEVGIEPPEDAPTIAAGSGTGLTGDYYGKVTFVNEYGSESNAGPASSKLTISDKDINWSSIPTGPVGTTARKLYRTKAGGSLYYFVHTIENNTATSYSGDNTPDSDLITPLETDNVTPPECSIVYEHKNYMLYASGNKLYFSKPKMPDSVPATSFKAFPGEILGVRTYQNALIVSGERFTHAIVGDIWDKAPVEIGGLDNTRRVVISNSEGCVSHEGMCEIFTTSGDYLIIPTLTDIKFLQPGYQEASLRTSTFARDIQNLFAYVANKDDICAVYDKERLLVALTYQGEDPGAETNNVILVFDTRTLKWSPPWHISCAGFAHAFNRLYIADSNLGQIHEFEAGSDDNGANIHAIAVLRPEYPDVRKRRFNHVRIGALPGSNTKAVKLTARVDGTESTIPIGSWGNNISPRIKLNLPRGYEYQLTVEDKSKNDFSIPYIVTEYERGE